MKKALMVEAGDVFPRTEGTVCTWVVCWRGHGPQADLVRSCARAVIADVPGPLTPGTPKWGAHPFPVPHANLYPLMSIQVHRALALTPQPRRKAPMLSMPASTVRVRHPHVERALIAIPILNTPNQCQVPTPLPSKIPSHAVPWPSPFSMYDPSEIPHQQHRKLSSFPTEPANALLLHTRLLDHPPQWH